MLIISNARACVARKIRKTCKFEIVQRQGKYDAHVEHANFVKVKWDCASNGKTIDTV